ncbi:MAG: hypothetical protein R2822_16670 [Spirosomataceae bacterium]
MASTILGLFIMYQLMKMATYLLPSSFFHSRVHGILHALHLLFLVLVVLGCGIELAYTLSTPHQAFEVVVCSFICIMKIVLYLIVELMADFIYMIKLKSPKNRFNNLTQTFQKTLSQFFGWFGFIRRMLNREKNESSSTKTKETRIEPNRRYNEESDLRPPLKIPSKDDVQRALRRRRKKSNRRK